MKKSNKFKSICKLISSPIIILPLFLTTLLLADYNHCFLAVCLLVIIISALITVQKK